jgi:hypothetical protein
MGRRAGYAAAALLVLASLAGCGAGKLALVEPGAVARLDSCLRRHGVTNLEESSRPTPQQLAIPSLLAFYGTPVPSGITLAHFERLVAECGGGISVGRKPVTSDIAKRAIGKLRECLAKNGYPLPSPNFPGPGPVLNTSGLNINTVRWRATVRGCETTPQLTKAELVRCVGAGALAGDVPMAPRFEDRILGLRRCLRAAAG